MNKLKFNIPSWILIWILFAPLSNGVAAQPAETSHLVFEAGASELRGALEQAPPYKAFLPFAQHDIQAHRLTYTTTYQSKDITVSGLIIVPRNISQPAPILIWNHGTTFSKEDGPSDWTDPNHIEVMPAMNGLITFLPDYIGYGVSKHVHHPYFIQESLVASTLDMIQPGKNYLEAQGIAFSDELYLWGFSEGGFATLAVQKEIETNPAYRDLHLIASYPVAGPYDLKASLDTILAKDSYPIPGYLAFIFSTYNEAYWKRPYTDFFQEPFATQVAKYAKHEEALDGFRNELPQALDSLFTPSFLSAYLADGEQAVKTSYTANSNFDDWIPKTPTFFYHGTNDTDVPYSIAETMYNELLKRGATPESVSLTPVEGADHNTSGAAALIAFLQSL